MNNKSASDIAISLFMSLALSEELKERFAAISMLALDVDGILTDSRVTYDSAGQEQKSFNIKDGLGIKLAQKAGIKVAIITGRVSPMVERRSEELGLDYVIQGREDKGTALKELSTESGIALENIAYAGDDLPDFQALKTAGIGITVADAHPEIIAIADWVTPLAGGCGAVRQICDALLLCCGQYDQITGTFKP